MQSLICAYSFCYVNIELGTAFIEPVCTREKYRGKGLCRQMIYGIINRLKEMRIEAVYINSKLEPQCQAIRDC